MVIQNIIGHQNYLNGITVTGSVDISGVTTFKTNIFVTGNGSYTGSVVASSFHGNGAGLTGIGSGNNYFDALVGSVNATYTSIGSALDAGMKRLLLVAGVTEGSDITFANDTYIKSQDKTLMSIDMDQYTFKSSLATTERVVFDDTTITYAHTGAGIPLFTNFTNLTLRDCNVINNSTATGCWVVTVNSGNFSRLPSGFYNTTFKLPNQDKCGFGYPVVTNDSLMEFKNIHLSGLGAGVYTIGSLPLNSNVDNLLINPDALDTTVGSYNLTIASSNLRKVNNTALGAASIFFTGRYANDINSVDVFNVASASTIERIFTNLSNNGLLIINTGENTTLSSGYCKALSIKDSQKLAKVNNMAVYTAVNISGGCQFHQFVNCDFKSGLTVSGNNNMFTNCKIGNTDGGGTATMDIIGSGNIVRGCLVDSAILDNGTDNSLDYVVF